MLRVTSILTFALAILLLVAPGRDASAQTRNEVVRWLGADVADTDGYVVHTGTASGSYSDSIDVGIPALVDGAYESIITVPVTADIYIAVTAHNSSGSSVFSNEICRGPDGPCGGTSEPPPPPPPPGAQSQVVGFKLWEATSDTVIDANFTSGESLSVVDYPCVAIEIIGNAYLSQSGPGSIRTSFDGQNPSSCSTPGVTHENTPPYAWERDNGLDQYECAPSLTVPGIHTLTVTPFDGDNCSGAQGAQVTLQFEVTDGTTSGPPPEEGAPGQPGRPQIVLP
jgi:hypothetical protein